MCANLVSAYPNESIYQVKERIIKSNVRQIDSLIGRAKSNGVVDAYTALTLKSEYVASLDLENTAYTLQSGETVKEKINRVKSAASNEDKTSKVFVKLEEGIEYSTLEKALSNFEYEYEYQMELTGLHVLKFLDVTDADRAIDVLNSKDYVNYAEPDYIFRD